VIHPHAVKRIPANSPCQWPGPAHGASVRAVIAPVIDDCVEWVLVNHGEKQKALHDSLELGKFPITLNVIPKTQTRGYEFTVGLCRQRATHQFLHKLHPSMMKVPKGFLGFIVANVRWRAAWVQVRRVHTQGRILRPPLTRPGARVDDLATLSPPARRPLALYPVG